jgi:hypothetical protein
MWDSVADSISETIENGNVSFLTRSTASFVFLSHSHVSHNIPIHCHSLTVIPFLFFLAILPSLSPCRRLTDMLRENDHLISFAPGSKSILYTNYRNACIYFTLNIGCGLFILLARSVQRVLHLHVIGLLCLLLFPYCEIIHDLKQ